MMALYNGEAGLAKGAQLEHLQSFAHLQVLGVLTSFRRQAADVTSTWSSLLAPYISQTTSKLASSPLLTLGRRRTLQCDDVSGLLHLCKSSLNFKEIRDNVSAP